jgi:hypothetical protein
MPEELRDECLRMNLQIMQKARGGAWKTGETDRINGADGRRQF